MSENSADVPVHLLQRIRRGLEASRKKRARRSSLMGQKTPTTAERNVVGPWMVLDKEGCVLSVCQSHSVALTVIEDANGVCVRPLVDRRAFRNELSAVKQAVVSKKLTRSGAPSWDDPKWDCWRCGDRIPYKSRYLRVVQRVDSCGGIALCEACREELRDRID